MISDERRLTLAEWLLEEVVAVSQEPAVISQVPEIKMLLAFLEEAGLELFFPDGDRSLCGTIYNFPNFSRFASGLQRLTAIALYMVFAEDAGISNICEYYVKAVTTASYGPESNCIFINTDFRETRRAMACLFLHELGHAQAAYCEGRTFKKVPRIDYERLREESAVWSLESRLMAALGGDQYLLLMRELVQAICEHWAGIRRYEDVVWEGKGGALDFCLGQAPCLNAKQERDKVFLLYCQLTAVEMFFPPEIRLGVKTQLMNDCTNGYGYGEKQLIINAALRHAR